MTTAVQRARRKRRRARGKSRDLTLTVLHRLADDKDVGAANVAECCDLILDLPLDDRRVLLGTLAGQPPGHARRWMIEQAARRMDVPAEDARLDELKWTAEDYSELVKLAATAPRVRADAYEEICRMAQEAVVELEAHIDEDGACTVSTRVLWEIIHDGIASIVPGDDGALVVDVGLLELCLTETAVTGTMLTTEWSWTPPNVSARELVEFAEAWQQARDRERRNAKPSDRRGV